MRERKGRLEVEHRLEGLEDDMRFRKTWAYRETLSASTLSATFVGNALGILMAYQMLQIFREVFSLLLYQDVYNNIKKDDTKNIYVRTCLIVVIYGTARFTSHRLKVYDNRGGRSRTWSEDVGNFTAVSYPVFVMW